jgi:glucosylglycerate synthase
MSVGEVDLLVGVPTHNNAKTVGQTVQAIRAGLLKYFPRERAVILNADGGSKDSTREVVSAAAINDLQRSSDLYALRTLPCISTVYGDSPAPEVAVRTTLAAAELLRARACAIVSAESTNITPDWIDRLLRPIYRDDFDLVTPVYRRHKFDGLLLRNLIYPMTRALYAKRVREPYAVEFAFSGRFCSHLQEGQVWNHEAGGIGTEMRMTIAAMVGGFRLYQTFLSAKPHLDRSSADLVPAMRQTVGTLFWSLEPNFQYWSANRNTESVPTCGPEYDLTTEPIRVNRKRLYELFRSGVAELEPVLKSILSSQTLADVQGIAQFAEDDFKYSHELWVRTAYEFASSYHKSVINRDHIIQALAPLYRGKVYTFLMENRDASGEEVEANVEELCLTFERLKPYLLDLWNAKE